MTKEIANWYKDWFDTDFYHILYQDRDNREAERFMKTLTSYLNLPEHAAILDLACGRGRHSVYLEQMGYRVTGIDLSENNIKYARKFENEHLHFDVKDMTRPFSGNFDAVFNLFTSFGYCEQDTDHVKTLVNIKNALSHSGFGVIDFMNTTQVCDHLIPRSEVILNGIKFHIHRYKEGGFIHKDIHFECDGIPYEFTERVRALTLNDFEHLFEQAGIYLLDVFGNYNLQKYHPEQSDRLVMIFK